MQLFFVAIGHISISDAAFALQLFSESVHYGNLAEKWFEVFNMYVAFKKLSDEDRLRLCHLLMTDRAADWLRAVPEHKKIDVDPLMHELVTRHQLSDIMRSGGRRPSY
jgi:hypothetical protein